MNDNYSYLPKNDRYEQKKSSVDSSESEKSWISQHGKGVTLISSDDPWFIKKEQEYEREKENHSEPHLEQFQESIPVQPIKIQHQKSSFPKTAIVLLFILALIIIFRYRLYSR